MRKFLFVGMLALVAGLFIAPTTAKAAMDQGDGKFSIHGEVRTRWEYLENHEDLTDTLSDSDCEGHGCLDDAYDIWPYRVRIGARGEFANNVIGYVELQNAGFFGNENPLKVDQHPTDQVYWNDIDDSEVKLYQGYIELDKIGGSSMSLRVGRQEHVIGNELLVGDADFYAGQSFDGARAWWNFDKFTLTAVYYNILEENAGCGNFCTDDNTTAYGVYGTWTFGKTPQVFEPVLFRYRDANEGPQFWVLDARYSRAVNSKADMEAMAWDWNIEIAMEDGSYDPAGIDQDIKASVMEGWFGWNFGSNARQRVHIGALVSSGDKDATDDKEETFIPIAGDVWAYNRLGDADWFSLDGEYSSGGGTGITDINLGYAYFGEKNQFRISLHNFTATEVDDGVDDALGDEIDIAYTYLYSANVSIDAGVASMSPGDYFKDWEGTGTGQDDVLRVWAQARLRF